MLVSVDGHTSVATEMETLLPGQHELVFSPGVPLQSGPGFWSPMSYRTNDVNLEAGKTYVAVPHFVRVDNDGHPIQAEVQAIPRTHLGGPLGDTWYYKWWVTVTEENKTP